jgi:ketosteroid isomerase-like protein
MLKKISLAGAIVLALCALSVAQQPDTRTGPRRKAPAASGSLAANQILQVERDWGQAYITHDLAALETILADDWTFSTADGGFKTTAQVIEEFRVDTMKYETITHQDEKVRVYGTTGVVTGEEIIKGSDGGRDVSLHTRFTDVFVRRDERWQVVASHESTIADAVASPAPAP